MAKPLKVMCVHGLGDQRQSNWAQTWQTAIEGALAGQGAAVQCVPVTYDPIFENVDLSLWETMRAVSKLVASAVSTTVTGRRGIVGDVSDKVRWTAGYVVAWLEDEDFKRRTRELMLKAVQTHAPDVILAHSLGSLITYNAFTHADASKPAVKAVLARASYVSLGSQIGNPFVIRNLTNGRIEAVPVREWVHLYNPEDDVFTAPIQLFDAANFRQLDTVFDEPGFADHSAERYLGHRNAIEAFWTPLAQARAMGARGLATAAATVPGGKRRAARGVTPRLAKRALLVGINNYPREADRLEGCVNDVFLMSSVLQECGFAPESIRVCLDERATASGIQERLQWLLDDPRPGEERVFYYSGHGARIPQYGEDFEPDRRTETLVPWDFDWTPEHAITDAQIYALYSQLPYDMRFAMILDCCHSGGMHRQGGARVRGINPPDDIRHREIKWDTRSDMWVPRDFKRINPRFSSDGKVNQAFFGDDGATSRLGRATMLRGLSQSAYRREKRAVRQSAVGPYLPLIIEACGEKEYSYEYRHGVTSYGAFTYALAKRLRQKGRITFKVLVEQAGKELAELGYQQSPQILGPGVVTGARVPWRS